mmetsp:Transcript_10620/g.25222  ORF Transcript_10620/g.25222 Transcript_10620/m.25222 type:complete len:229 (-) Transcript_10620:473-1159(-)
MRWHVVGDHVGLELLHLVLETRLAGGRLGEELRDPAGAPRKERAPEHHHKDRDRALLRGRRGDVAVADRRHRGDGPVEGGDPLVVDLPLDDVAVLVLDVLRERPPSLGRDADPEPDAAEPMAHERHRAQQLDGCDREDAARILEVESFNHAAQAVEAEQLDQTQQPQHFGERAHAGCHAVHVLPRDLAKAIQRKVSFEVAFTDGVKVVDQLPVRSSFLGNLPPRSVEA